MQKLIELWQRELYIHEESSKFVSNFKQIVNIFQASIPRNTFSRSDPLSKTSFRCRYVDPACCKSEVAAVTTKFKNNNRDATVPPKVHSISTNSFTAKVCVNCAIFTGAVLSRQALDQPQ